MCGDRTHLCSLVVAVFARVIIECVARLDVTVYKGLCKGVTLSVQLRCGGAKVYEALQSIPCEAQTTPVNTREVHTNMCTHEHYGWAWPRAVACSVDICMHVSCVSVFCVCVCVCVCLTHMLSMPPSMKGVTITAR